MIEIIALFTALVALEIILEIDNLTALQKAAAGLPDTPWCKGQGPHALALGVRVCLTYVLFHVVAYFAKLPSSRGHGFAEQCGGLLLILVASALVFNYLRAVQKKPNGNVSRNIKPRKTSLFGFLVADAFLSMDTVIAAVAMTTDFNLAVAAMITASLCIMCFHEKLHDWLKVNPRAALLAFIIIGLLGVNLILAGAGHHIPKYFLLAFVYLGIVFNDLDKKLQEKKAAERANYNKSMSAKRSTGAGTHLAQTIQGSDKSRTVQSETAVQSRTAAQTRTATQTRTTRNAGLALVEEIQNKAVITAVVEDSCPNICSACGTRQKTNSSICHACGQYCFFTPGEHLQEIVLFSAGRN